MGFDVPICPSYHQSKLVCKWFWENGLWALLSLAMGANLWLQMTWLFLQELFDNLHFLSFQEFWAYAVSMNWMILWKWWLCDWLKVAVFTFKLFSWREQIGSVSCNIPSNSFVLRYHVMMSIIWDATDGLVVIISPVTSCVTTNLICQPSWFWRSTIFFFNCCIHIIVKARFNKVRRKVYKFHCCVIEWSNMSMRVKCRKMFLSSQRLIRRNPHLAFYFNWNPIFVISTNLLMVR